MNKKKIAIFQRDLSIGGIQRSLLNLIHGIDTGLFEIDLFLFAEPEICSRGDLDGVGLYILEPLFYANRTVPFDFLKKHIKLKLPQKKYDVAIDFNSYSNECALGCLQVDATKRVMWIHNDIEIEYETTSKYKILYNFFKGKFKYYDEFVAVSRGIVEPFSKKTGIDKKKIRVIPNMIDTKSIIEKSKENVDFKTDETKTNFVFVGRLTRQKGVDILLDDFANALKERTDIHLYIIGDGEEKENIISQISDLKINNFVTMLGAKSNPFPYIDKMDTLILTSRHEGQGMVLLEGKTLGLDLIFPKNLEKYNVDLVGCENVIKSIVSQRKHEKSTDTLDEYNLNIRLSLYELFES